LRDIRKHACRCATLNSAIGRRHLCVHQSGAALHLVVHCLADKPAKQHVAGALLHQHASLSHMGEKTLFMRQSASFSHSRIGRHE
jgi:hypothetical protein